MSTTNKLQHPGLTSFQLKTKHLMSRFLVAPMSRVSATNTGVPTDTMRKYYTDFAIGGFSMIITEGIYTDNLFSQGYPCQPGMVKSAQVKEWKNISASVKKEGAVFIAQLMHAGALSQHLSKTKAPSAVQPVGVKMPEYGGGEGTFRMPEAMNKQDIANVIKGFENSALYAFKAGFDGIEIHAANGYLLDQFLTPYTNLRVDEYGETIENRFRIIAEIINSIRSQVPSHFIVGLRLSEGKVNNLYYRWPGGTEMAKAMLQEANKAKPDYIHIAAESGNWKRDCTYADGSSYTSLARQITGLPVIANGGLHQLQLSEVVLKEGHADLLAIGSAALADPQWPNKIAQGIEPIAFQREFIKPSATIEHTNHMRDQLISKMDKQQHQFSKIVS